MNIGKIVRIATKLAPIVVATVPVVKVAISGVKTVIRDEKAKGVR